MKNKITNILIIVKRNTTKKYFERNNKNAKKIWNGIKKL